MWRKQLKSIRFLKPEATQYSSSLNISIHTIFPFLGFYVMVSVVALGCHPDDVESGCFGTLALYRKNNAVVSDAVRCLARFRAYQMRRLGGAVEAFQVVNGFWRS